MPSRKIGAHVSSAGGTYKAIERANEIGANCVQVFSGSPRMWRLSDLSAVDTQKLFAKQKELTVSPIFTHAIYLINLASDNPELIRKSLETLKHDLEFDALVKGSGVVVHVGSHQGRGWAAVRDQVRDKIMEVLATTPDNSTFLIENSAGQKGKVGSPLSEVRWLLDEVKSPRLGWCFDTCHALASGYFLGDPAQQQVLPEKMKTTAESAYSAYVCEEISQLDLWASLKCIHVNDSKFEQGSGRDRHENILEGQIPAADWGYFLNHEPVTKIPLILEVPGFKGEGPDKENIERVKRLIKA